MAREWLAVAQVCDLRKSRDAIRKEDQSAEGPRLVVYRLHPVPRQGRAFTDPARALVGRNPLPCIQYAMLFRWYKPVPPLSDLSCFHRLHHENRTSDEVERRSRKTLRESLRPFPQPDQVRILPPHRSQRRWP